MTEVIDIIMPPPPPDQTVYGSTAVIDVTLEGPPGPRGADGSAPQAFPVTAVSTFSVAHGYAYAPAVRVLDINNHLVLIAPQYPDPQHVVLTFTTPFSGVILLS